MAARSMLSLRVNVAAGREAARLRNGRFGTWQKASERVFRRIGNELQEDAISTLRFTSDETIARSRVATTWPYLHRRTGRLERAIAASANIAPTSTSVEFMNMRFMDSRAVYWRAIEWGTTAHVGRFLHAGERTSWSATEAKRSSAMIARPILPHRYAQTAWDTVDWRRRSFMLLKEAYPNFDWKRA